MVRTQVQFTEEQAKAVRKIAAQRGISMAELIREAVDRIVADANQADKWERARSIAGRFSSGLTDVSINHDKYLEEDYLA